MDTFLTSWLELLSIIMLYVGCSVLTLTLIFMAAGVIALVVEVIREFREGQP